MGCGASAEPTDEKTRQRASSTRYENDTASSPAPQTDPSTPTSRSSAMSNETSRARRAELLRQARHELAIAAESGEDLSPEEQHEVEKLHQSIKRVKPKDRTFALVQSRWREAGSDMPKLVAALRRHLESHQEVVQEFFLGVDLTIQAHRLLTMFGQALDSIDEAQHFLTQMTELGVRHCMYGVNAAEYELFEGFVCESLGEVLGEEKFDEQTNLAFRRAWSMVRNTMEQGARSLEGQAMLRRRLQRRMEIASSCWNIVRAYDKNAEVPFTKVWYNLAAEQHGVEFAKKLGEFTSRKGLVMKTLGEVVQKRVSDPQMVESMLRSLGSRHLNYNTVPDDYPLMGNTFIEALSLVMPDGLSSEQEAAWKDVWNYMADLMIDGATEGLNSFENLHAPRETPLALMFTDIENSTALWAASKYHMGQAVELHHKIIRQTMGDHHGYEVKTVGDAFMIAFKTINQALGAALDLQLRLFNADWGDFDLAMTGVEMKGLGPASAWGKGLRVRTGVHLCHDVAPTYDAVHQRYDYYGPDVNCTSRIQSVACGGQVMMTTETRDACAREVTTVQNTSFDGPTTPGLDAKHLTGFAGRAPSNHSASPSATLGDILNPKRSKWEPVGRGIELKGVSEPVDLISALPVELFERQFPPIITGSTG